MVASALYRMHVYQEAYGFTQLRLLVDVFEGWLGLLVLGVLAAGVRLRATWLPRAALLSGAGSLLLLAAINPDAWVAQRNIDRYEETGKVDWYYLRELSDDAVPGARHPPGRRGRVRADGARPSEPTTTGWSGTSAGTAPHPLKDAHLEDWHYSDAVCVPAQTGG